MFAVRGRSLATSVLVAFLLAISMIGLQAPQAVAAAEPTVTSVSPSKGPRAGGTVVTVNGTNFIGVKKVLFGTKPGTSVKVTSTTTLTAVAPAASLGVVDVRVVSSTGTSPASDTDKFTYLAPPTITGLSTARGTTGGGTMVTVTGTGFDDVSAVKFGTTPGTNLTVISGTQLSILTPKHAAGRVDLRIASASRGITVKTRVDQFTFVAAPKITGITPVTGPTAGSTRVKITGSNLIDITAVAFGGTSGTALVVSSSTKLYVTTPAGTAGSVNVTVTGAHGTSALVKAARFTYIAPPTITKISPSAASYKGGTKVTITGTSFKRVTSVLFDGKAGTKLKVVSATKLTVQVPKHAPSTVDVRVITRYGRSPVGDQTKFVYLGKPVITGISPATGTTLGGTSVHITGTGLTGTTRILFGTTKTTAGLKVVSDRELTVIAPRHAAGQVNVRAVNSRGTSPATAAGRYTYQTPAVPNSFAVQVEARGAHTCAVTREGAVKCWGGNDFGNLGDGTTTNRRTPVGVVGLGSGVRAISAGWGYTCALTTGGAVKCWGENHRGQLGDGTTTDRHTPVQVVGLGSGVTAISAGYDYMCALTTGGAVKCWGHNEYGKLGDGTTTNRRTPVGVVGLNSGVAAISSGADFTCALMSSGAVKCWGYNESGDLGDGTTTNRHTPVGVIGLETGVSAISVGNGNACVLTTSGAVKCLDPWFDTPYNGVGLDSGMSAISVGTGDFLKCALTNDGAVKCWGYNGAGEVGDGTTTTRDEPVGVVGLNAGVTAVSAGHDHTCAVTTGGAVTCWGSNNGGQLGDGTRTDRHTPVGVVGFG